MNYLPCSPDFNKRILSANVNAILIKNQENIDKIHILVDDMRIKYFKIYYFAPE